MKFTPKPSGPCSVAFTDIINKYGPDRSLFRLYYPTSAQVDPTAAYPWIDDPEYGEGYASFIRLKFMAGIFKWMFSHVYVPAVENGPLKIPSNTSKLPVVIFSHGLGANKSTYTTICTELASQGMFVAALEHADQSASATYYLEDTTTSNGSEACTPHIIKKWVEFLHCRNSPDEQRIRNEQVHSRGNDCSEALNILETMDKGSAEVVQCRVDLASFEGTMDFSKCSVVGHSFGGATALAAISKDDRFKAGVGLDTWMFPLDKDILRNVKSAHFLFINSETFHWPSNIASMRKLDSDTLGTNAERLMVTLNGTVHQSQSDFPVLLQNRILSSVFKVRGPADPVMVHRLNNKLTYSFLAQHLHLDCDSSCNDVMEGHKDLVFFGSNVEVDEERVKASKEEMRSPL